ncbi:AlpA family transcriptional regulator [soil metagenome]
MPEKVLRVHQVKDRTGLSRSGIYALQQRGEFPRSVPLSDSGRAVGWLESEIDEFIRDRVRVSRGEPAAA